MTERLLIVNLCAILVYMSVWFVIARQRKRLDTVDTAWGTGFILAAWLVAVQSPSIRSLVLALLVTVWGARLTGHIYQRSSQRDEDPRYTELSRKWKGNFWLRAYSSIFIVQGLLIWLVSIPLVFAAGQPLDGLGWLTIAGSLLWLFGFLYESVADRQLAQFLQTKPAKGSVMDRGLWAYSRHPNYFGELVQWWAIAVVAVQAAFGWIGLLGPLVLTVLIRFVSGVPIIEKRRKDNAAYQRYKRHTTSALLPWKRAGTA